MGSTPVDGRAGIDAALVHRLVARQFPQWADLAMRPVAVDGWDNRTYRLGEHLTARLPTRPAYAEAVPKEHRWLPVLGPLLPLPVPEPLALGAPGEGYPHRWSVRRWIPGGTAEHDRVDDLCHVAVTLAEFLLALQQVDAGDGPGAGAHSFHRGAPPAHYDDETRRALRALDGELDAASASSVWQAAVDASCTGPPVWFHGDVAGGNLVVRDGRLAAVIDFGTCGVGDPACDLGIAWTFFHGPSRKVFRDAVAQDDATWARARGWALWKALVTLDAEDVDRRTAARQRRIVEDVLAEDRSVAGRNR